MGWHNAPMAKLTVFNVPGLSARLLAVRAAELPNLRELFAATVVVLDGASPDQLETALITGMLPEYHGRGRPFWDGIPARVKTEHPLPDSWRVWDDDPQLVFQTREPDLTALDAELGDGPVAVLSAYALVNGQPAGQNAHALDRPVLLTRGIQQDKTWVGILEIAGILRRALTDEKLTDAL